MVCQDYGLYRTDDHLEHVKHLTAQMYFVLGKNRYEIRRKSPVVFALVRGRRSVRTLRQQKVKRDKTVFWGLRHKISRVQKSPQH